MLSSINHEIVNEIHFQDAHDTPALTSAEVEDLANDLTSTVVSSIEKYLKGKAKHGGFLASRDCLADALQEVTDLNIYLRQELRNRNTMIARSQDMLVKENTNLRSTLQDVADALKTSNAL